MEKQKAIELSWFWTKLITVLPAHTKRLLLMASLVKVSDKADGDDARAIESINQLLQLATTGSEALKFPMQPTVCNAIWNHPEVIESDIAVLKSRQNERDVKMQHAYRIVESIPSWFRYTDPREIARDIVSLFEFDRNPESRIFKPA